MANLTGEYDVATEVSVGLVNCVLAAIHENEDEAYPRLLHSLRVRVDDVHRGAGDPIPEAERTGVRTTAEVQVSTPTVSFLQEGLADVMWSRTRAPVRTAVQASVGAPEVIDPIGPIHPGSTPTCWPRITARVRVRAWLRNTPGVLPEFLHGDLHLTAGLMRTDPWLPNAPGALSEVLHGDRHLSDGLMRTDPLRLATFLGLDQTSGLEVRFQPATGSTLTDAQRALVERILRNFIRSDIKPVTFKLTPPPEVRRFDYRLQPGGPRPSAMLMFTLAVPGRPDRPPGPQGPASVSARFLPSGADFAVAVGLDYLVDAFKGFFRRLSGGEFDESGSIGPFSYTAHARPDWATAAVDLEPGRIVLSLSGSGSSTLSILPTDYWNFTIRVAITLQVVGGSLRLALAGDPEVDFDDVAIGEDEIEEGVRDGVKERIEGLLQDPPPEVQQALDVGSVLEKILATLHPSSPGVTLTGVEIRPDGAVVAGTVALAPTRPVEVRQVGVGGLDDALESWIPGGTIERFVWGSHVEEHRFVTEQTVASITRPRCLSVQGTRVSRGGGLAPVTADDCPVLVAILPILRELPTPSGPSRRPLLPLLGGTPDGPVEVVGHYDPWASGLAPPGGPTNLLAHFAGGSWAEAAAALDKALAATEKRDAALVVVGVVGAGELARAAGATLDADATLLLAEDASGQWATAFGVSKAPATVLVGPDGQVRWKDEAALDPRKLGRVLDEHLEPGGEVSWRPLRPVVAAGDRAPNASLELGDGRELGLRGLLGESVVLSFWTSSSEPSLEQLRQLRDALESGREDRPYVLGIGDGETPRQVTEVARREQLPFPLVPDPERSIARRFAVSFWPYTMLVGPEGRVEATDLGLVPGLSPCDQPWWPPLAGR